jgi:hypothetical protein
MRKIGRIVADITEDSCKELGIYIKEFSLTQAERSMEMYGSRPGGVGFNGKIVLTLFTNDQQELFEVFEELRKISKDFKKLAIRPVR